MEACNRLIRLFLAAVIGSTVLGSNAFSATLDFTIVTGGFSVQSYVDATDPSNPDASAAIDGGGNIAGEAGFGSLLLDVDGINLDIALTDIADGNPYFDDKYQTRVGGLGSCRDLNGAAQCTPSSDDNLTINENEMLNFVFQTDAGAGALANFGNFTFRDDDHFLITGTIQVSHDGGSALIAVTNGIGDLSGIGPSSFLTFNDQAGATQNYYISEAVISPIPVPAAVWLFGSALGLLGWARRRAA